MPPRSRTSEKLRSASSAPSLNASLATPERSRAQLLYTARRASSSPGAARLSMTTMASGRWSRAGMSTCSTKARNTAVPVAAAHPERQATRGPRGDAHARNGPVERKGTEHGQPLPMSPRHLAHGALTCCGTGVSPGHPGVDPTLVKEDEALGVHFGQLRSRCAYSAKVRPLRSATSSLSVFKAFASRRGAGPPACGRASSRTSLHHAYCQQWSVLLPAQNRAATDARLSPPCAHTRNARSRSSAV
jgi:hypothetical protein